MLRVAVVTSISRYPVGRSGQTANLTKLKLLCWSIIMDEYESINSLWYEPSNDTGRLISLSIEDLDTLSKEDIVSWEEFSELTLYRTFRNEGHWDGREARKLRTINEHERKRWDVIKMKYGFLS